MTRSRGNGEENVTTVRRDEKWKDDKDLIFCREDGQPLCTRVFTRLTCSFVPSLNSKRLPYLFLLIFVLPFILLGCQAVENPVYAHQQKAESIGSPVLDMLFEKDPVMNLLGKSFDEIKQVLGEPDEQGYSGWLGPHYYILYRHKEGVIRFSSPKTIENKIAVSIILGPKQEVLGAKVGMVFLEIKDILGVPDFGPELGMDNLYYMDYFFGETNHQIPEVFISFSADRINGYTNDVFIKWEAFEDGQMEILQTAK